MKLWPTTIVQLILFQLFALVFGSNHRLSRGGFYQYFPGYYGSLERRDEEANIKEMSKFRPNAIITDNDRIKMEHNIYDIYADALKQLKEVEILYQPVHANKPIRMVLPTPDTPDEQSYPEDYQKKFPR